MKCVLDTDVLVASLRSSTGASRQIISRIGRGELIMLASVAIMIEYEAVLTRLEHLTAANLNKEQVGIFLDALASLAIPVTPHFLWRPLLKDPNDEMIVECAVNGQADVIVTFNTRHFGNVARRYGIEVLKPGELIGRDRR